jgi:tryptophan synthase alpha chain
MGYFNPIYIFGKTKFIDQCKKSGVDGLIIVDLPPEEDEELYIEAENKKLSCIRLVTPTTHNTRLAKILSNATGFIYYVSITGITGTQSPETGHVSSNIKNIKSFSDLPIVVGFGIRSPNQALSMAQISDGVVIGSAVVDLIKESLDQNGNSTEITANSCLDFIHEVSKEMKHN